MTRTGADARPPLDLDERAESFFDALRTHSRALALGLVGIAVVVGGVAFYRSFDAKKTENAEQALRQARQAYESGNMALAQTDLKKVVDRYGGTRAGSEARILLAHTYYQAGKPAEGIQALEGAGGAGSTGAAVAAARAAGLELEGKAAEAAAAYLQAAERATTAPEKLAYRADAARAYQAAGQKAEAEKLWRELAESTDPGIAAEAHLRLGEVTAAPASRS